MSRRSSSTVRDEDRAKPYQVYTEAINTGKTVGASKRKVKWRYGWTDSEEEKEIEFIHSLMTGKRVSNNHLCEINDIF